MASFGIKNSTVLCVMGIVISGMLLSGCSSVKELTVSPRSPKDGALAPLSTAQDPFVRENIEGMKPVVTPSAPAKPDFQPVSDDISPARSRLVNIQARNTALGDILHVVANAAGMNLVIGEGVRQDRPVTITLNKVTADDALAIILGSADYFYTIKGNTLTIEATVTKVFELGHPALVQGYSLEVGGDILGSGQSAGKSSGNSNSSIKGNISQNAKSDAKAFDFWEALESSLQGIVGGHKQGASGGAVPLAPTKVVVETNAKGGQASSTDKMSLKEPGKESSPSDSISRRGLLDESLGQGERAEAQQSVIVNRLTGTIVVTAAKKNMEKVESYLDTLRKSLSRQVLVEARVIEVKLSDSLKYGIDWSFLNNIDWFNAVGAATGGFGALNMGTRSYTGAVDNTVPSFRLGYSGGNVQALLSALKTQGEVKTLSNPRINVMNGQTAMLSVGRNYNYIASVTSTSVVVAGSVPTITYTVETNNVLSGIMIGLAPQISSKGDISMTVTPIISDLVSLDSQSIGSNDSGGIAQVSLPIVDLRELSTTIKVHDGEMIVIGGLISNKQSLEDTKVPLLADVPWIGGLFKQKDNSDTRSELVVILQPRIVTND